MNTYSEPGSNDAAATGVDINVLGVNPETFGTGLMLNVSTLGIHNLPHYKTDSVQGTQELDVADARSLLHGTLTLVPVVDKVR